MFLLLNVAILPLNVVVLGLLHEGLRVVFHSAIGPTVPRCEPCHCNEQIMRTQILVTERHAAVRTLEAKQWSQVMKSGLSTGKLVIWYGKIPVANSSRIGLSRRWRPLVSSCPCVAGLFAAQLARARPGPSGWCSGDSPPLASWKRRAQRRNGCSCERCVMRSGF